MDWNGVVQVGGITIVETEFHDNQAFLGGAFVGDTARIEVIACVIEDNLAEYVGGVAWLIDSELLMEDMFLEPNIALNAEGIGFEGLSSIQMRNVVWADCCLVSPYVVQDLGGNDLGWPCEGCVGDVTCDGSTTASDVGRLLSAFGTDQIRYDLNLNGVVDGADLGLLFTSWGDCAP